MTDSPTSADVPTLTVFDSARESTPDILLEKALDALEFFSGRANEDGGNTRGEDVTAARSRITALFASRTLTPEEARAVESFTPSESQTWGYVVEFGRAVRSANAKLRRTSEAQP